MIEYVDLKEFTNSVRDNSMRIEKLQRKKVINCYERILRENERKNKRNN